MNRFYNSKMWYKCIREEFTQIEMLVQQIAHPLRLFGQMNQIEIGEKPEENAARLSSRSVSSARTRHVLRQYRVEKTSRWSNRCADVWKARPKELVAIGFGWAKLDASERSEGRRTSSERMRDRSPNFLRGRNSWCCVECRFLPLGSAYSTLIRFINASLAKIVWTSSETGQSDGSESSCSVHSNDGFNTRRCCRSVASFNAGKPKTKL